MGRHAEWRKVAKKLRRKRIRTMLAVARDQQLLKEQKEREKSPTYRAWLEEQQVLEEFNAAEEQRLAMQQQKQWEAAEESALLRWREQQSRLAQAKAEKFKREMMIKEEWEREQRKIQEAEEARKKSEDEKKRKQAELLAQIDAFIEGRADLPDEVNVSTQTQPGQQDCPFFSKTGACRFRDSCSRNHTRPGISRTLMVPNFYDHFGLTTLNHDEYDTDLSLEYEESETYQHFKEFYNDVLPEFEQCGRVIQFKVCNNEEPHLRGNVYVEFHSRRHALKAYRKFQGRYYAGRRLNVEFTTIPSWKNAVCGLFHRQKCPKGKTCNFLHVFRNPNNAFKIPDGHSSSRQQFSRSRSRSPRHRSRSKEWDWLSDGSDSEGDRRRKRSRSGSRSRIRTRKYESDSENNQRSRSKSPRRSKVPSRNRSRSRDRDRRRRDGKEKRKDERYRSYSRSPQRDRKRHKDDSREHRKSKRDKHEAEANDSEETSKNKKYKDDDKKRSSDSKYTKETEFKNSKLDKKLKDDDKKKSSDTRNGKDTIGREDATKHGKQTKDDSKKRSITDSEKEEYERKHKKDDSKKRSITDSEKEEYERKHKKDKRDGSDSKYKKRSVDDYNSSYKKSSDSECNGKEERTEKYGDTKTKNLQDDIL